MAAKKKQIAEAIADAASDNTKRKLDLGKLFKPMSRGSRSDVDEYIPSGLEVLNKYVFGCGGWPVKRFVELYGPPASCKTSLTLDALAGAQKAGGAAILIECENALQTARATIFGCDLDEVLLSEPASIEEVIDVMRAGLQALPAGIGPNMMAWDSLAMSSLEATVEDGREAKGGMGAGKAQLLAVQLPPIVQLAAQKRTCMLIVNQAKTKIGVAFGDPTTTPGGETHKFASSIRLQAFGGAKAEVSGKRIGIDTTIVASKNKLAVPHKKAKIRLIYETGWDDRWTTINLAKDLKLIPSTAKPTDATHQAARVALGWAVGKPVELELDFQEEDDGIAGLSTSDDGF